MDGVRRKERKIKYSFSQRTISEWNELRHDCINAGSVDKKKWELSCEGELHLS